MGKKGQITVFIIIAIVLLVSIGVYLTYNSFFLGNTKQGPVNQADVQFKDKQNIQNSVESCMKILAIDGLEIMRIQGGYINVPDVQTISAVDRKDGAYVYSGGKIKEVRYGSQTEKNNMPFWVTKDDLFVPSKEKMEEELATYIQQNMLVCLNDFKEYRDQGIIIKYGQLNTTINFSESVIVNLDWKIDVTSGENKISFDKFVYYIPVNMKKIYDLSANIAFSEIDNAFLEYFTADLISKYGYMGGKKGNDDIPPMRYTDVNTDCISQTWTLDEVKGIMKKILYTNFGYVQLYNSDYTMPQKPALKSYMFTPFQGKFDNTKVDFFYDPDFFMDLKIKPGGSTIKPDKSLTSSIPFIPMFCTYKYRFKYDMEYPVIVSVTDKGSAKLDAQNHLYSEGEGFTFYFPVYVYVCGNQKRKCNVKDYSINKDALNNVLSDEANVDVSNALGADTTPFCNEDQMQSDEMTIEVLDSDNFMPIKNAQIGYYGGNYLNDCLIGATDENGTLRTRMPFCSGCLAHISAVNYSMKYERFDVGPVMDSKKTFVLDPIKDYNVEIKLVYLPIFTRFWMSHVITASPSINALSMGLDEKAVEQATKKNISELKASELMLLTPMLGTTDLKEGISVFVSGSGPTDINFMSNVKEEGYGKAKIGPGTYKINFIAMSKVNIAPSQIDTGNGESKTLSLNPSGFGNYNGDWVLGTYDSVYTFTPEDLRGKNTIVFLVPVNYMPLDLKEALDIQNNIMQPDGKLVYKESPKDQEPLISIEKKDYAPYLSPLLR